MNLNRILIVDDTPENLQILGMVLKKEGYQIMVAGDGLQAMEAVAASKPDLILLDVMMPRMDGFTLCTRLKAEPETADIPVIFLTAKTAVEDVIKGFELGAVDYVTKPFNLREVLARTATHLKVQSLLQELAEKNRVLQEMVITDGLTQIYNRRHVMDRLEVEISLALRHQHPLSIIMFDVDHFKNVNDTYGHQVGDQVLTQIAQCVKANIRKTDLVGRYGGEEFLVLLPHTDNLNSREVAEHLRHEVDSLGWEAAGLTTTISGGVASLEGQSLKELLQEADLLLYQAKTKGRNRICWSEEG